VVKEIEALTNTNPLQFQVKTLINDNYEREAATINSDNIRYDSSPTLTMGVIVSPKKKFLIRSQSHTEPTSPMQNNNNNNLSQSQQSNNNGSILNTQNGHDDENSIDDPVDSQFTRLADLSTVTHPSDTHFNNNNHQFKPKMENGNEQHLNTQSRVDQNGMSHSMIKQQPMIISNNINHNKRTFPQANIGKILSKPVNFNLILIYEIGFIEAHAL